MEELAEDAGGDGRSSRRRRAPDGDHDRRPLRRRARASRRARPPRSPSTRARSHFFDPETGLGIYDDDSTKGAVHEQAPGRHRRRSSSSLLALRRGGLRRRRRASSRARARRRRRRRGERERLGQRLDRSASGRAPEQKSFQAVLDGFKKKYPNVKVKYTSAGDNIPTVLSTAVAGRQPARPRRGRRSPGLVKDFAEQGRAEADHLRARRRSRRTTRPSGSSSATVNGKLYGLIFKGANKSTVWYNVHAFKNAGVQPPKTWHAAPERGEDAEGLGHPGVLDRRRRRLDAHRPVREHLPAPGRPGRSTTS